MFYCYFITILMISFTLKADRPQYVRTGQQEENAKFVVRDITLVIKNSSYYSCVFDEQDLNDAEFTNSKFGYSSFKNAILNKAKFINVDLTDVSFENAHLAKAKFYNVNLRGASFKGANLAGARFENCVLEVSQDERTVGVVAKPPIFKDAILRNAFIKNVNWHLADLSHADLNDARLSGVNLSGANINGLLYADAGYELFGGWLRVTEAWLMEEIALINRRNESSHLQTRVNSAPNPNARPQPIIRPTQSMGNKSVESLDIRDFLAKPKDNFHVFSAFSSGNTARWTNYTLSPK